jgi:hypothetical protein
MAGFAGPAPGAGGAPGTGRAFGLTAALAGGAAPGEVRAFGLMAALAGGGGAPLAPGTGSVLALGTGCAGSTAGAFAGWSAFDRPFGPAGAPGKPVLTAGLIVALGGTGALPCWISVARCATAGGKVGVTAPCPGAAGEPGRPALSPGPAAGGGGPRLLMTLSMTARLWMLAKMTLFGGGAT